MGTSASPGPMACFFGGKMAKSPSSRSISKGLFKHWDSLSPEQRATRAPGLRDRWKGHGPPENRQRIPEESEAFDIPSDAFSADDESGEWEVIEGEEE